MVDFFDPGGGSPGTSFVQTAYQRDPRAIMAALLMRNAQEGVNQPSPNPLSALARAFTMGVSAIPQAVLAKEYQGRDEAARKTMADALSAMDKGTTRDLYDPGIPGTTQPTTTTEQVDQPGMGAALKVLAANPDTASLGMSQALALGLAGAKSKLEMTNKLAENGLMLGPSGIVPIPGFGASKGTNAAAELQPQIPVQAEAARQKFFATPQALAPATSIVDLSGTQPGAAGGGGARPLATNTMSPMNVVLNTQKTFGQEAATKAADIVAGSADQAKAAVTTVNTTNRIRQALDQANLGPTATLRQGIDQIAYGLGMGDQNTEQRLASTRQVVQGLAELSLTARSALKGQGQVSDYEGKLLARARSGDIDGMTMPEIKAVLDVSDRLARTQYDNHQTNLEAFKKAPGSDMLTPFYTPPPMPDRAAAPAPSTPPAAAAPSAQGAQSRKAADYAEGTRATVGDKTYEARGGKWVEVK